MRNTSKLKDISANLKELASVADVGKIDVPFTQISNRAQILDLSKIPSPRMGIERIDISEIELVDNEFGPNGEPVKRSILDIYGVVRAVGDWRLIDDGYGKRLQVGSASVDNFIEIIFYGTGLNIVSLPFSSYDMRFSVDGGAETGNIFNGTESDVIGNRGYKKNVPITLPQLQNLTLGLHTVKLRSNTSSNTIYGFEIINESTTLDVPAGTLLANGNSLQTLGESVSYNTGFANEFNTGSITKGGHVLTYLENGSVKKDITWTDSVQKNLGAADHSNESVVKKINWREFGAGRADDFSTAIPGSPAVINRAFTLDDGTTTLVAKRTSTAVNSNGLSYDNVSGNFITITFVGTGLDLLLKSDGATRTFDAVSIDGAASSGSISNPANAEQINTVVSGLPYGTHTVELSNTGANFSPAIFDFIIYGPKKPELPVNAGKIGSYFLMADFVANATVNDLNISTGALSKVNMREFLYTGTQGVSAIFVGRKSGFEITAAGTSSISYTFFGTGFDFRSAVGVGVDIDVTLDTGSGPLALNSTNFPTAVTSSYGTSSFSLSTAKITGTAIQAGSGCVVSGLPLAVYTVKFNDAVGTHERFDGLDVITPIHSYESDSKLLHDRLVGSNSLKSEIGIPDFISGKKHFPDGVDLGKSKVKWQEKIYTGASITSGTGTINEISFNNLTVGKTYKLSMGFAGYHDSTDEAADDGAAIDATHNGASILTMRHRSASAADIVYKGNSVVFTAKSTSISMNYAVTGFAGIYGSSGSKSTKARLEELPNHIETDEW